MDTKQNHKTKCYHIHSKNLYSIYINLGIKKCVITDMTNKSNLNPSCVRYRHPFCPDVNTRRYPWLPESHFVLQWQSADNWSGSDKARRCIQINRACNIKMQPFLILHTHSGQTPESLMHNAHKHIKLINSSLKHLIKIVFEFDLQRLLRLNHPHNHLSSCMQLTGFLNLYQPSNICYKKAII